MYCDVNEAPAQHRVQPTAGLGEFFHVESPQRLPAWSALVRPAAADADRWAALRDRRLSRQRVPVHHRYDVPARGLTVLSALCDTHDITASTQSLRSHLPSEGTTMQTIFPIVRYDDARAAIEWLCRVVGFELTFCVPADGSVVQHARLQLAGNRVMLGSVRAGEPTFVSPHTVHVITQAICVYITDIDVHYQQAVAAHAAIIHPLADTGFGARQYEVADPEGHRWIFTTPADLGTT
jgi:uncharacterized glyoxalase superfamily protein PhnB